MCKSCAGKSCFREHTAEIQPVKASFR
jgi:hypothetical protein